MKYFLWVTALFLSLFLQGRIDLLGVTPDLTALFAYYIGIRAGQTAGLFSGAAAGILEDSVSFSLIGPNVVGKSIVGFFSSAFISGGVFRWTPLLGILAVFTLTFMDNAVVFLLRSIFDKMPAPPTSALFVALMQSLLNAPAGMFIRPKHVD